MKERLTHYCLIEFEIQWPATATLLLLYVITDKGLFLIHCNGHSNNGYLVYGFCMLGQNSQVTNLNNMICTNFKIVLLYFSAAATNIKANVLVHMLFFLKFYKYINYLYIILRDLKKIQTWNCTIIRSLLLWCRPASCIYRSTYKSPPELMLNRVLPSYTWRMITNGKTISLYFCKMSENVQKYNIYIILQKIKVFFCKYLSISVWIPLSFEK